MYWLLCSRSGFPSVVGWRFMMLATLRAQNGVCSQLLRQRFRQRFPNKGFEGLPSICLEGSHARGIIEINGLHHVAKLRECGLALRRAASCRRLAARVAFNQIKNDGCVLVESFS